MREVFTILALLTLACPFARATDPFWITYSNGTLGFFAIYGPERMMHFHPPDFGLDYPFQIESLATRFYAGMGSWRDSVFLFKIYGDDGTTLLFASETLIAPRSLNARYGLPTPLEIDSGDFYAGLAVRYESLGFAYPFLTTDDNTSASHSLYGEPGNWQAWTTGEYFISALVRYTGVGTGERPAPIAARPVPGSGIVRSQVILSTSSPAARLSLFDLSGQPVMPLWSGTNDIRRLSAGVYFICQSATAEPQAPLVARIIVVR